MLLFGGSNAEFKKPIEKRSLLIKQADEHSKRIVTAITGTGRSGTSLLMALFTKLKLPTGYGYDDSVVEQFIKTGISAFEFPQDAILQRFSGQPGHYAGIDIFKSPWYVHSQQLLELFTRECSSYRLCEVIVPVRNVTSAAYSRYANFLKGIAAGNLTTPTVEDQIEHDAVLMGNMITSFVESDLPIALLAYPRFTTDIEYLYHKLKYFFVRHNISKETVNATLSQLVGHHVKP
jgi:hypothetical protein